MDKDELRKKRNRTIESLNDIKAILGLDELYIAELEEENADLEKENAELEAKNEANENGAKKYAEFYFETNEQLTKAKEIIKKFSEFANLEVEYDPEHPQEHTDLWNELCKEAEQFINIEVEK